MVDLRYQFYSDTVFQKARFLLFRFEIENLPSFLEMSAIKRTPYSRQWSRLSEAKQTACVDI